MTPSEQEHQFDLCEEKLKAFARVLSYVLGQNRLIAKCHTEREWSIGMEQDAEFETESVQLVMFVAPLRVTVLSVNPNDLHDHLDFYFMLLGKFTRSAGYVASTLHLGLNQYDMVCSDLGGPEARALYELELMAGAGRTTP